MKRAIAVVGAMIVGVSLLLYAGWHNLRERRLAMQQASAAHMTMMPDGSKQGSAVADGEDSPGPKMIGKLAPGFTLVTLDGKKVSLADYKGRPVLVNFWATWCAPCKVEMPWFAEFRQQYASQGFEILGVLSDDAPKDEVRKVTAKLGVNYPILLEGESKVEKDYQAGDYLPTSFYIDRTGMVVEETSGLGGKDEIEAHIKKIIASTAAAANHAGDGRAAGDRPLVAEASIPAGKR